MKQAGSLHRVRAHFKGERRYSPVFDASFDLSYWNKIFVIGGDRFICFHLINFLRFAAFCANKWLRFWFFGLGHES